MPKSPLRGMVDGPLAWACYVLLWLSPLAFVVAGDWLAAGVLWIAPTYTTVLLWLGRRDNECPTPGGSATE